MENRFYGNFEANDLDHSKQTTEEAEALRNKYQETTGDFEAHDTEHRGASDEVDVRIRKEKEAPVYEQLNEIIEKGLPNNSDELKNFLISIGCREDFICYLLKGEKQKFINVMNETIGKYDSFNSGKFNEAAFEYFALINVLEELGVSHLAKSYSDTYNPYYVELDLLQIAQVVWKRAKNGADISVPIPKGYDFSNPQPTCDLLKIIDCTEKTINKNHYIEELWKSIGYINVNEDKKTK